MVRRSESGFQAGVVVTVLGGIALSVGAAWLIAQATSDYGSGCTDADNATMKCVLAGVIGGVGAVSLAVGIPVVVNSGQMVPAPSAASSGSTTAAWWYPTSVSLGRSSLHLGWTF
jgi:hypothetical protein